MFRIFQALRQRRDKATAAQLIKEHGLRSDNAVAAVLFKWLAENVLRDFEISYRNVFPKVGIETPHINMEFITKMGRALTQGIDENSKAMFSIEDVMQRLSTVKEMADSYTALAPGADASKVPVDFLNTFVISIEANFDVFGENVRRLCEERGIIFPTVRAYDQKGRTGR